MSVNATQRSGPFWDAAQGRIPLPRAAATLGLEVIDADVNNRTIEVAFTASADFTTPRGDVLEGFLAAMLADTVGPAVLATLEPTQFITTLDLNAHFLRPAFPGRLIGRGRVVQRNGDIASVEASLFDSDGATVATGTSTIRVFTFDPPA